MRVIAVLCHSPTALTGTVYRLLKETRMTLAKTDLQAWLAIFFGVSAITALLRAESPIQSAPAIETTLRISISRFQNPPEPLAIDFRRGIGPDEAAAIALYSNPALRAIRDDAQNFDIAFSE